MTTSSCEKCGAQDREINHCDLIGAWLCRSCYLRSTALTWQVEAVLEARPMLRANIARAVGRDRRDGSVGRALDRLVGHGLAVHEAAGWRAPRRGEAEPATSKASLDRDGVR